MLSKKSITDIRDRKAEHLSGSCFRVSNKANNNCFHNDKGISIYVIISIVGLLALAFILILPQAMDIQRREKAEQCISNMRELDDAIRRYMAEREENFRGEARDLNRTGYLRRPVYVCPSGTPESHYFLEGNYETFEVIVRCPLHQENPEEFPDHRLPDAD